MVPQTNVSITGIREVLQSSLTYRIDFDLNQVVGRITNQEAILQMVRLLLSTERYSQVIYTGQYGVELEGLIGKDYDYIVAELPRIINEALLVDNRITKIINYVFKKTNLDSMQVSFDVFSIYGKISTEMEVAI
ncbi:MAG: DUF2634 domain-containing protein [Eubacteriales bacterium]|nr:DUF2634 domain-containing protein [Eubacteriales bacterium]